MTTKEKLLTDFLKQLDKHVYVKSTNSVTGQVEELKPTIQDQEEIIIISGEWDREDLKNILASLV